jgi:Ca2+-binding EF-hand superfamily protein
MLAKYFDVLDKDHDGSLDMAELEAASKMMPQRRRQAPSTAAEAFSSAEKGSTK